jgi:hypothetical protein
MRGRGAATQRRSDARLRPIVVKAQLTCVRDKGERFSLAYTWDETELLHNDSVCKILPFDRHAYTIQCEIIVRERQPRAVVERTEESERERERERER